MNPARAEADKSLKIAVANLSIVRADYRDRRFSDGESMRAACAPAELEATSPPAPRS